MINVNFCLSNPWSTVFDNLWCRAYATPFKNKSIELEVTKDCTLLSFAFSWSIRQSHAGINLELGLFGYNVHCQFYDSRHWNAQLGRYYTELEVQ